MLDQGSDPSHSFNPSCSCGHTRSLTLWAGPGIQPASQRSQNAASLVAPQQELLLITVISAFLGHHCFLPTSLKSLPCLAIAHMTRVIPLSLVLKVFGEASSSNFRGLHSAVWFTVHPERCAHSCLFALLPDASQRPSAQQPLCHCPLPRHIWGWMCLCALAFPTASKPSDKTVPLLPPIPLGEPVLGRSELMCVEALGGGVA